jgi:aminopeptidase N
MGSWVPGRISVESAGTKIRFWYGMQITRKSLLVLLLLGSLPAGMAQGAIPDVASYHLDLSVDRAERLITGIQTIEIRGSDLSTATFPLYDHEILSVTTPQGVELPYESENGLLAIELPERRNSVAVRIEYRVRNPKGIVFLDEVAYTNFETCHWMICNEDPARKAKFSLTLTTTDGDAVLASGSQWKVESLDEGVQRFHWRQEREYSTYLFGFGVGRLASASRRDGRVTLQALSASVPHSELERYLEATSGMIRLFESAAGVTLPTTRYSQLIVEGSAAQEKSTFSIIGTEQLAALAEDPTEDWVIAHELAHQFWGNLVTPATWNDLWISEGLAVFMTAVWKENRWGREYYDREMELARARLQRAIDADFDVPLAWKGEYPSLEIKRAIAYSKGALFFDELRQRLGPERMVEAMRAFTRRHAAGVVTSRNLQLSFESTSGEDLSELFDTWVWGEQSPAPPASPLDTEN